MARDYVEILKRLEAHYPQAATDTDLKRTLTGFANDLIAEIDREQRWSLSFNEPSFPTVSGTSAYALPFPASASTSLISQLAIDRMYWIDTPTGKLHTLSRLDKAELQRVWGEGANALPGKPRYFSLDAAPTYSGGAPTMQVTLYPTPDGLGPDGGNYTIRMAGYFTIPPIIEVQGSTSASSTTLTVPSGTPTFLTDNGEPTSSAAMGLSVSIRNAGRPGIAGLNDTHVTTWTAFPTATTITLGVAAVATISNQQVFFNSTNWLITHWPKVLIFGMAREIATYYGSLEKYTVWESRFQDQMNRLRNYEFDRARGSDSHAVAYPGGEMSSLKVQDNGPLAYDVRG